VVVELNLRHQVQFYAATLPSHVSLKQPFAFDDLAQLDVYTQSLAARIPPFEIRLERFYWGEWGSTGILGLEVAESPRLRALHNLLNQELSIQFKDARAEHDGEEYRFHLTIEMGSFSEVNPFRAYYDNLPDPRVELAFTCRELGVFFYTAEPYRAGSFIHYQTLPLRGSAE
jgi:2'-5' RNA ligase